MSFDFSARYRDVTFPGRHPEERILLVLRRHWFVLVTTGLLCAFLLFFPLVVWGLLPEAFVRILSATAWSGVVTLLLAAYYLFLWLFFFTIFMDYYLDVWIVTNERILSIEQVGLFRRVIAEQTLVRVQDVTSDVRGIFPTFLSFGNVFVQTAGERERFVFLQVPRPDIVKKVIVLAHEEAVRGLLHTDKEGMMQTGETHGSPHLKHGHAEQL